MHASTFFFSNRNFIAVQIFTRPISSPPAGTLRFAQSPLRWLAITSAIDRLCPGVFFFLFFILFYLPSAVPLDLLIFSLIWIYLSSDGVPLSSDPVIPAAKKSTPWAMENIFLI